mmetsp:Transcript_26928/g.59826  ORF Transcript_26928/g.59826 Transcript_26928/m.59826 type:complete len:109 (-) Transcript_26928:439-765(-)
MTLLSHYLRPGGWPGEQWETSGGPLTLVHAAKGSCLKRHASQRKAKENMTCATYSKLKRRYGKAKDVPCDLFNSVGQAQALPPPSPASTLTRANQDEKYQGEFFLLQR